MIGLIAQCGAVSVIVAGFFWIAVKPKSLRQVFGFIVATLFIVGMTGLLYWYLGAYSQQAEHEFQLTHAEEIKDNVNYFREHPDELVEKLKAQVESHPDQIKGWMLLGRVYASAGRYPEASGAFAKALQLDKQDDAIQLSYLQAKALSGQWQAPEEQLLQQLFAKQPNDPSVLHLIASKEFSDRHYAQALLHWQQALANLPDTEKTARTAITTAIERVKQLTSSSAGKQITVACDIKPALRARYSPETVVLIYAKAKKGPPMPLAVIKRQVKDFPLTVTLSDQDAMIPEMNLSKFDEIELFARVSQHGQAQVEAGDAIGSVAWNKKLDVQRVLISTTVSG